MSDTADQIVAAITAQWAAAFTRLDAAALSSLYSDHALFYGSNPTLYRGRDGVAAYFNALPRWAAPRVTFSDVSATRPTPDVVSMAGMARFMVSDADAPLTVKITWVLTREVEGWKIVSHHVSSPAPLIEQVVAAP